MDKLLGELIMRFQGVLPANIEVITNYRKKKEKI